MTVRIALRLAIAVAVCICIASVAQVAIPGQAAQAAVAQVGARHVSKAAARPAGVVAKAGELLDLTTGKRLWSRDVRAKLPIASITKVMTAMVVLSAGDLNRKIRVTQAAVNYALDHSAGSAGLRAGDVLTAGQLLQALLLPSGADAAYLLSRSYGPGWRKFVRKMNATAARLGMTRTHFANYDGLPWPTETSTYSTARDVVVLGKAAMKNTTFRKIVAERGHSIAATSQHHKYHWANTDLLLRRYRGAIGIKTGFTTAAGYCLLFEARRHGTTLIGVVLDSTNTNTTTRFTAAAKLLNWGFARVG
ncbi:MAG TPA: serine hydrolase [Streptosporangiaceae bacterium]|nr:serine hydrolase [Streptosporangiaceae bacterium]